MGTVRYKYDGMVREAAVATRNLVEAQLLNLDRVLCADPAQLERLLRAECACVGAALDAVTGIYRTLSDRAQLLRANMFELERLEGAPLPDVMRVVAEVADPREAHGLRLLAASLEGNEPASPALPEIPSSD